MATTSPEDQYRAAWKSWLLATTREEREPLEKLMDELQPQIASGPKDPRWLAFKQTLHGFDKVWANLAQRALRRLYIGGV